MATIPEMLAVSAKNTPLKTTLINNDGHTLCIARRDTGCWEISLVADSRSSYIKIYYRHEEYDAEQIVTDFDTLIDLANDDSIFGELITKCPVMTQRDTAVHDIVKDYAVLPWETGSSRDFLFEGHSMVCEECAKEFFFTNPGTIVQVDSTHTGKLECMSNNPCGNFVGQKCSTEGCDNPAQDGDNIFCEHCESSLMSYPSSSADPSDVLEAMQEYLRRNIGHGDEDEDEIENLCQECAVFPSSDAIRWPESVDVDEDDWDDFWISIS